MPEPKDCHNLKEIRIEIDQINREIIALIGKRFTYVKAAANFKNRALDVQAPERVKSILEQRRIWAEIEGLNPDVIENIYRDLVKYFINQELNNWNQAQSTNDQ